MFLPFPEVQTGRCSFGSGCDGHEVDGQESSGERLARRRAGAIEPPMVEVSVERIGKRIGIKLGQIVFSKTAEFGG